MSKATAASPASQSTTQRTSMPRRAKLIKRESSFFATLPEAKKKSAAKPTKTIDKKKKRASSSSSSKKNKKKKVVRKYKPTYNVMIGRAIRDLKQRGGASAIAIAGYIQDKYPVPDTFKTHLRLALRRAVDDGVLIKGDTGARFRLSASGRNKLIKPRRSRSRSKSRSSSSKSRSRSRSRKASSDASDSESEASSSSSSSSKSKGKKKGKGKGKSKSKASSSSSSTTKKSSSSSKKSNASASSSSSSSKKKTTSPAGYAFKWQYQDGGWSDYDETASDVVERAYQDYLKHPGMCDVRSVKSGQWSYQVDFRNNRQTNVVHDNHTVRNIRRLPYAAA